MSITPPYPLPPQQPAVDHPLEIVVQPPDEVFLGPPGPPGEQGEPGEPGPPGVGVPEVLVQADFPAADPENPTILIQTDGDDFQIWFWEA